MGGCTLQGRSQVVSMATTVWEATPCWTALSSVASRADTPLSTCWARTGRTPLWQLSRARPEPRASADRFLHEPQLGERHQESSWHALVALVSPRDHGPGGCRCEE